MRPVNEQAEFTIATDVKDGKVRVVVTALDKEGRISQLPQHERRRHRAGDGKRSTCNCGRKRRAGTSARCPPRKAGSYLLAINPGKGPTARSRCS